MEFTHIKEGAAQQVDITGKPITVRRAVANGFIELKPNTIKAIKKGMVEKGNVLNTARIAAIMASKRTSDIIPLCHQISLTAVNVDFGIKGYAIETVVEVKSVGRTGVEMEAITGVTVALLTIWDMVKSAEKDETGNYPTTRIYGIKVLQKEKST
jgi:cyclic pyranopterin phosphate synthase